MYKACPRCKGALMIEGDHHGWYEQCLQCGYHRDMESLDKLPEQSRTDKGVTKAANGRLS